MSVGPAELNNDQNNSGGADNQQGQDINVNPNWKPFLDVLPDVMHSQVLPVLQNWDQGVQQKLQEVRQQYEPYKDLIDNGVDPEDLEAAFALRDALNGDPAKFIQDAVEWYSTNVPGFNLNLQSPQQQQQNNNQNQEFADFNDPNLTAEDLMKDPRLSALLNPIMQQQNQIMTQFQTQQSKAEEDAAEAEWNEYLKELHTEHGDFDDDYVTALCAQDIDGDDAVQRYKDLVSQAAQALTGNPSNTQQQQNNQQQNNQQVPPVVMGGGGNSGGGVPSSAIDFSQLAPKDTNNLVVQALQAAAAANANQT